MAEVATVAVQVFLSGSVVGLVLYLVFEHVNGVGR